MAMTIYGSPAARGACRPRRQIFDVAVHIGHGAIARMRLWRERSRSRRQLAAMSERDLNDLGLSWSMIEYEASKPFWR